MKRITLGPTELPNDKNLGRRFTQINADVSLFFDIISANQRRRSASHSFEVRTFYTFNVGQSLVNVPAPHLLHS